MSLMQESEKDKKLNPKWRQSSRTGATREAQKMFSFRLSLGLLQTAQHLTAVLTCNHWLVHITNLSVGNEVDTFHYTR